MGGTIFELTLVTAHMSHVQSLIDEVPLTIVLLIRHLFLCRIIFVQTILTAALVNHTLSGILEGTLAVKPAGTPIPFIAGPIQKCELALPHLLVQLPLALKPIPKFVDFSSEAVFDGLTGVDSAIVFECHDIVGHLGRLCP